MWRARPMDGPDDESGRLVGGKRGPSLLGDHAVSAGALRSIEVLVRALEEAGRVELTALERGHPDADEHRDLLELELKALLLDLLTDLLGQLDGPLPVGLGQDQDELLAAITSERLLAPDAAGDELPELLE